MSTQKDGGPAFPVVRDGDYESYILKFGMTHTQIRHDATRLFRGACNAVS